RAGRPGSSAAGRQRRGIAGRSRSIRPGGRQRRGFDLPGAGTGRPRHRPRAAGGCGALAGRLPPGGPLRARRGAGGQRGFASVVRRQRLRGRLEPIPQEDHAMSPPTSFEIAGRRVGPNDPPFVIAEMSGNHNQSLERALAIVEAAAKAGAHALKIQTYTADTMTIDVDDGAFRIADPASLWKGKSLHRLYQEAYTPWEWHGPIFERARALGMIAFSTPFDESAVDFLESLDAPCYKIASFENTDIPLVRRVAATGKPMIVSTGMASVAELDETVRAARDAGCRDLVLLKCTSTYPATPEHTNVATIPHMRELFSCQVGLSDHTMGVGVAVAAVALGATVVEKHFTLARD